MTINFRKYLILWKLNILPCFTQIIVENDNSSVRRTFWNFGHFIKSLLNFQSSLLGKELKPSIENLNIFNWIFLGKLINYF